MVVDQLEVRQIRRLGASRGLVDRLEAEDGVDGESHEERLPEDVVQELGDELVLSCGKRAQARVSVDFDQLHVQLAVDHEVKAEQLEAQLARAVFVCQLCRSLEGQQREVLRDSRVP